MSKTTWTLVDKGTPNERWTATLNGHTLEVWEDEEQAEEDAECWGWRVTRPDGLTEDGDSTSKDGAMETAEWYARPDEEPANKKKDSGLPTHCSGCGCELREQDRAFGACSPCWNKTMV